MPINVEEQKLLSKKWYVIICIKLVRIGGFFQSSKSNVSEHIKHIFEEGTTIRKFRIVQNEGKRQVSREVIHYNFEMIIVVDFKVNNEQSVHFRKQAGQIIKNYTIQGWTMNIECLKKVTDLYVAAFDYYKEVKATKLF